SRASSRTGGKGGPYGLRRRRSRRRASSRARGRLLTATGSQSSRLATGLGSRRRSALGMPARGDRGRRRPGEGPAQEARLEPAEVGTWRARTRARLAAPRSFGGALDVVAGDDEVAAGLVDLERAAPVPAAAVQARLDDDVDPV